MKPHQLLALLFGALLAALILVGPVLGLAGCAEQPDVPTAAGIAAEGVETAREHMDDVADALEQAEQTIITATKLHAALTAFRTAYDAEHYSEALGHLRKAVVEAEAAGFEVPPDVVEKLGLAQLILEGAGS